MMSCVAAVVCVIPQAIWGVVMRSVVLTLRMHRFEVFLSVVLLGLLAVDFFLRGFGPRSASPFAQISKKLIGFLKLKPQPIALAPKQFAARIGFFLSSLALVFYLFDWATTGIFTAATILGFAVLEGFLGICVACIFYPFVVRWQER